MAEYRYYLIPDAMTRAFPEQFGKQTPTEFFDNIADLEKRYHQLREMPYNNERTWNERARFPYERLVVGVDRQNPDGEVAVIQVRNGINYLCDDYRGPYADGSDAQIPQMAKKLVEVIGVDRVRPHTYTQRDGYTWVQVEKDMHITEWLYAHELCSSLQFTRFLNRDGRELFQVRDGQRVIETNADGTKRLRAVKNIDVTHAYVGHYGCHVQQYADANFKSGCYVTPEHPQPGEIWISCKFTKSLPTPTIALCVTATPRTASVQRITAACILQICPKITIWKSAFGSLTPPAALAAAVCAHFRSATLWS